MQADREADRETGREHQIINMRRDLEVLNSFDLVVTTSIMQSCDGLSKSVCVMRV